MTKTGDLQKYMNSNPTQKLSGMMNKIFFIFYFRDVMTDAEVESYETLMRDLTNVRCTKDNAQMSAHISGEY